jgi:hypothetical protein
VDYRLYFMDRLGGHIERRIDLIADDDSAAIGTAASYANGQPMELWRRHQKIKSWEAHKSQPPAGAASDPNARLS